MRTGIRAARPDEIWHIDTTVLRLLDGTRAYLHAVLDNYPRRILSWRLSGRFDPGVSAALLAEAGKHLDSDNASLMLLADAGVEYRDRAADDLGATGRLRRVLAMTSSASRTRSSRRGGDHPSTNDSTSIKSTRSPPSGGSSRSM